MRISQKGALDASVLFGITIVVLVSGFIVYRVIDINTSEEVAEIQEAPETQAEPVSARGEISIDLEPGINISNTEELKLLPAGAPLSFANYMESLVVDNQPSENGCVTSYTITRITSTSAKGSTSTIDAATGGSSISCGGAAGVSWYMFGGEWNIISNQTAFECESSPEIRETEECIEYYGYLAEYGDYESDDHSDGDQDGDITDEVFNSVN